MPLRPRASKRPKKYVETIRELNELGLVKGPAAAAACKKTDDEIAIQEKGSGFIPAPYCPGDVSVNLANQMRALTREATTKGLSLSILWGTAKRPGILTELINSQGEWSSKKTTYVRVEIVERAREELWRMANENYYGLFICSTFVNVLLLIYILFVPK
ncbi:hypothetical protein EV127DRAFT_404853 [Xylaria flabelliformis]|nr:hypothetical protein EV127DRAFT_404853 [Xylaria flabelliformis]